MSIDFLQSVYRNEEEDIGRRIQCAQIAAQYETAKPAPMGKKEAKQEAARKAGAANRFASTAPPKLVVNNQK